MKADDRGSDVQVDEGGEVICVDGFGNGSFEELSCEPQDEDREEGLADDVVDC